MIDYSKGLSAEEKKEHALQGKVNFGQIKAGSIAAKGNTSGASVQTATPARQQKDRERRAKNNDGDGTVAESVKTYDVATTIGSEKDGSDHSLSSGSSIESVDMEEYVNRKKKASESRRPRENEVEAEREVDEPDAGPPSIRRTSEVGGLRGGVSVGEDATMGVDVGSDSHAKDRTAEIGSEMNAAIAKRIRLEREQEMAERDEIVCEMGRHIERSMKCENPTGLDVLETAELLEAEMAKTEFLNTTGFLETEEKNNFDGLADELLQNFIMEHGEGDNKKALLFVRCVIAEMKRMLEDEQLRLAHDSDDFHEAREQEEESVADGSHVNKVNEDNGNTSKTQQEELQAKANDEGQSAAGAAGQMAP